MAQPKVKRIGSKIYYRNVLLATLHEDINLTVEPKELERFNNRIERQSKKAKKRGEPLNESAYIKGHADIGALKCAAGQ